MIIQERKKKKIYKFLNQELFLILKKLNSIIGDDYYDFNYLIENPIILKSRSYQKTLENSFKIFEEGLSLSLDWILYIENQKTKDNTKTEGYYKGREKFIEKINILINYEKEILKNYEESNSNTNKLPNNLLKFECENNLDFNNILFDSFLDDNEDRPEDNSSLLSHEQIKSPEYSFDKNKDFFTDINRFIFANKNIINNNQIYNEKKINFKENNLKLINLNKNNNNNSNNSDSFSINASSIGNKRSSKISIQSKGSAKSYDLRKKKIKEYKFVEFKRENIDKKIIRKFKKFLKTKLKEKTDNEIKNYIINNEFWLDYIKLNLMPPFIYEKEKITFKSFNTQYLCWLFEHKFSSELFNIFIDLNYDIILYYIKKKYSLVEKSEDYILLQNYLYSMPLIYRKENNHNNSTEYSNNLKLFEDEIISNNQIDIEKEKDNDNENNDKKMINMILEDDLIHDNEKIINPNNISLNIKNNIISSNEINNVNNFCNNDDTLGLQSFLYGDDSNKNNLDLNFMSKEFNINDSNDSFEENKNRYFSPSKNNHI